MEFSLILTTLEGESYILAPRQGDFARMVVISPIELVSYVFVQSHPHRVRGRFLRHRLVKKFPCCLPPSDFAWTQADSFDSQAFIAPHQPKFATLPVSALNGPYFPPPGFSLNYFHRCWTFLSNERTRNFWILPLLYVLTAASSFKG